jgi:hypothetical protein
MNMTKDQVKKLLAVGVATVTFIKKDGTVRVMQATLDPKNLPVVEARPNTTPRKENPDVVAVYDMEKSAWRSFRIDSVTSIETA